MLNNFKRSYEVQTIKKVESILDAPGGTGKTFLINLLLSKVRGQQSVAIVAASSGIAVTLLRNGRTAHVSFNLPMDLAQTNQASCTISRARDKAKVLEKARFMVWDEYTMAHVGS